MPGPQKGQGGRRPKTTTLIVREVESLPHTKQLLVLSRVRSYVKELLESSNIQNDNNPASDVASLGSDSSDQDIS